jgi:hypothetical protein
MRMHCDALTVLPFMVVEFGIRAANHYEAWELGAKASKYLQCRIASLHTTFDPFTNT